MTIIGIDTASRVGGVAILREGRYVGGELTGVEEGHSEHLIPALQRQLALLAIEPDDVKGVAVTHGPGSFTGLRIGLAAVKGVAYAWGVPVVGVSTLLATAWSFRGVDAVICASLDARRASVYRGVYDGLVLGRSDGQTAALTAHEERVGLPEVARELNEYVAAGRQVILVGEGAPLVDAELKKVQQEQGALACENRVVCAPLFAEPQRPANVAQIGMEELERGHRDDPFSIVPNYLRRSEAERRWEQRQS